MIKKQLVIKNETGIHARPAALLVQVCNKYKSEVELVTGSKKVNAKSIIGIMSLGMTKGTEFHVVAEGPDESNAVTEIANFFDNLVD